MTRSAALLYPTFTCDPHCRSFANVSQDGSYRKVFKLLMSHVTNSAAAGLLCLAFANFLSRGNAGDEDRSASDCSAMAGLTPAGSHAWRMLNSLMPL